METLLRFGVSLVPVFCFLLALAALDSYKLVRARALVQALAWGVVVALAALVGARAVISGGHVDAVFYSRYVAPLVEELGKALFVVFLVRTHRVGFTVDAAILGFAVGAGFATVENIYYLSALSDLDLVTCGIRGFGTAVLHGGTTAIFAMLAKLLPEIRPGARAWAFAPGLVLAVAMHALFNHFVLSPIVFSLVQITTSPLVVFAVFSRSERLLAGWLEVGFESHVELLELLRSGEVGQTRLGQYLRALRDRFPGEVLADMLCYVQIWVELSIKAKSRLLAQQAGFPPPADRGIADRLAELSFLEKNIGPTGRLALAPFLRTTGRSVWELRMLRQSAAASAPRR